MGGERAVIRGRNQNRKGIGAHEGDRGGVIFDAKVFGDVHALSLFLGLRLNLLTTTGDTESHRVELHHFLTCSTFLLWQSRFLYSRAHHGWGGTARPRP